MEEDPKTKSGKCDNLKWTFRFWLAVAAAICVGISVGVQYVQDDLFTRKIRQYEVRTEHTLPFPKIYICNNVKQDVSPDYPKHIDCKLFPIIFESEIYPCKPSQPFQTLTVLNRTCIVYDGLIAQKTDNALRIAVDVGNHSSLYAPWKGAFMFLKSSLSTPLPDLRNIKQWQILESQRYYLVQLRVERRATTSSYKEIPRSKESIYKTEVTRSGLLDHYTGTQTNATSVTIDFFFLNFEVTTITKFPLRNWSLFLADLGGSAGIFSVVMVAVGILYSLIRLCKQ